MRLSNEVFLRQLGWMCKQSKDSGKSGSVFVTMKRIVEQVEVKRGNETVPQNRCLVRAVWGRKKVSTVVTSKDRIKFTMAYTSVLKQSITGLKKKVKKKKNKKTTTTTTTTSQ